jgi:hypothetical protein
VPKSTPVNDPQAIEQTVPPRCAMQGQSVVSRHFERGHPNKVSMKKKEKRRKLGDGGGIYTFGKRR